MKDAGRSRPSLGVRDTSSVQSVAEPVIELVGISKRYRTGGEVVVALNEVDILVQAGDFVAVMGASGSGKSTLLNIIGCLDRPTAGRYLLEREDVSALDDDWLSSIRLRRIGFIFQNFNLIPQLTVLENIELPLFYQGLPEEHCRKLALELAAGVGLSGRLAHRPVELSGGQQQRVAVARALANDPAFLLADEPTGNLDSVTSKQIMELLTTLNKAGKTIIMVTHEADIASYAGRTFVMHDGRGQWR